MTLPNDGRFAHTVACGTTIGSTHEKNQDFGGAWAWQRPNGMPASLIVVADGVSSGAYSEVASRMAVEILHDRLHHKLNDPNVDIDELRGDLVEASRAAGREIAARPHDGLGAADATTLVAAVAVGREVAGLWVGDSRIYRIVRDGVARVTRDHSWAEEVVSNRIMTAEQAAGDPRAHMITRWLGPQEQVHGGPDTFGFSLDVGDTLLCCSDGLYMYFSSPYGDEEEMRKLLEKRAGNLQTGIDTLIQRAVQRGGHDDITAAALHLASADDRPRRRFFGYRS